MSFTVAVLWLHKIFIVWILSDCGFIVRFPKLEIILVSSDRSSLWVLYLEAFQTHSDKGVYVACTDSEGWTRARIQSYHLALLCLLRYFVSQLLVFSA